MNNQNTLPELVTLKRILLGIIVLHGAICDSFGWWANRNDWGALQGKGGYSYFACYKSSNNLRGDWAGVYRNSAGQIILYPSAVEGWNSGTNDFYMYIKLESSTSYATSYLQPTMSNTGESNDSFNVSIDVWLHKQQSGSPSGEMMYWTNWKNLQPIGVLKPAKLGIEYWEGSTGIKVATYRSWNGNGSIDLKRLAIAVWGTTAGYRISGIHAGAEVSQGAANLVLNGYTVSYHSN